jgi:hypothetical protein
MPVRSSMVSATSRPTPPRAPLDAAVNDHAPSLRPRAFRDADDAEPFAAPRPVATGLENRFPPERYLGDQNDIGAAGDPGVEGQPSGVAPHHLGDHDPVVGAGGRVEAVEGVGRDADGRLEPERQFRARDVVVNRLRDADHGDAEPEESPGYGHRAVAADDDQAVEPVLAEDGQGPGASVGHDRLAAPFLGPGERVGRVGRSEDRAA